MKLLMLFVELSDDQHCCVFQSVTAVEAADDHNSYWRIRSKMGSNCVRG